MSVRLCMLARDEAHRIPSVAEACRGLYDDWIILLDDRGTDATERVAHESLEGDGRVVHFRFENFSQARNALFEAARPGAEWLLLADPDSPPTGALPGLVADWYECSWWMGRQEYRLPILVRADLDCHYEGACHELLIIPEGASGAYAEDLRVDVKAKPLNAERLEGYLELLIPDARENARSAFYLARTYDTLGRKGEAIEAYLYAAHLVQPPEQAFLCVQSAGILFRPIDVELARVLLERASEMRPWRGETLYHLAWLANRSGDPQRAAAYCARAVQLPACPDTLFVDRWAERDGVLVELGRALDTMQADAPPTLEP